MQILWAFRCNPLRGQPRAQEKNLTTDLTDDTDGETRTEKENHKGTRREKRNSPQKAFSGPLWFSVFFPNLRGKKFLISVFPCRQPPFRTHHGFFLNFELLTGCMEGQQFKIAGDTRGGRSGARAA
jgi:hypothetical protein